MKKAVLFDLDGTLWDSTPRLVESFNRVMEENWPELGITVTLERMRSGMGMNRVDLRNHLFPSAPEEMREELIGACFDAEVEYLRTHRGDPFPGMEEMLATLSRDYFVGIVSNCQAGYIEAFLESIGVGQYISDHECFATGLPKGQNIRLLMERNGIDRAIYVGDTQGDLDAADMAEVPFVYAAYGFGSVNRETAKIDAPAELPALVRELLG